MTTRDKWAGFPRSDRPHISPSRLDTFLRCPEQYRRSLTEKIPPGIALIKGSGLHAAAGRNYQQKIASHEDLPESVILEAAATGFEEACSGGIYFAPDEVGRVKQVLGQAKDSTLGMAQAFRREIAPRVQPTLVETWFRIELPRSSHDLLGRIDVADADGVVRDTKTSNKRKNQSEVDRSDQLTIYALAGRQLTGQRPTGVALDVLIGTKVPSAQILTSTRDERDVRVCLNRVNAMLAGIKAGSFPPCAIGSWCCSPKYCGYFATCAYVNSDRVSAADSNGGN